jgi:hypothetical protein
VNGLNIAMSGIIVRIFLRLIAMLVVSLTTAQFVECALGCDCSLATGASSVASRASADKDGCLCCSQCLGAREPLVFLPDSQVESVAPRSPREVPVAPP